MMVDPWDLQHKHDHDHDHKIGPSPASAQLTEPNLPTLHHPTIVCFLAVNRLHTGRGTPNSSLCADPLSVPGPVTVKDEEEEEASISDNSNKLSSVSSILVPLSQSSSGETGSGHSGMFVNKDSNVREQPKLSQLIGYCIIEYLKLERKRKFKYTCLYSQLLCMGFTAFGAQGFLPSIHLRVLVWTHNCKALKGTPRGGFLFSSLVWW